MNTKDFMIGYILGSSDSSSSLYGGTPVFDAYGDYGDGTPYHVTDITANSQDEAVQMICDALNLCGWKTEGFTSLVNGSEVKVTSKSGKSGVWNIRNFKWGNQTMTLFCTDSFASVCLLRSKYVKYASCISYIGTTSDNRLIPDIDSVVNPEPWLAIDSGLESHFNFTSMCSHGYLEQPATFKKISPPECPLYRLSHKPVETENVFHFNHLYTTTGLIEVKDVGHIVWINDEKFFALGQRLLYKIKKDEGEERK